MDEGALDQKIRCTLLCKPGELSLLAWNVTLLHFLQAQAER